MSYYNNVAHLPAGRQGDTFIGNWTFILSSIEGLVICHYISTLTTPPDSIFSVFPNNKASSPKKGKCPAMRMGLGHHQLSMNNDINEQQCVYDNTAEGDTLLLIIN